MYFHAEKMSHLPGDQLLQVETACGSFLYELQVIWDEVGESDAERDKMVLEIEQECLVVYRTKVDQANRCRAQLRQEIADSEAELVAICSALGERPLHLNRNYGSLKEELKAITPQLEEMRKRKVERENQFVGVKDQLKKISFELGATEYAESNFTMNNSDLSVRRLEDLQRQLESLQKEKSDRLQILMQYLNKLNSLCVVLGIDFKETIREIHPSLNETEGLKCINKAITETIASAIHRLRELKIERMQKLQDLATSMLELWNLMDTPSEEQQQFRNVTCNIAASEEEITEANALSNDFIKYVEAEVSRLEQVKVSKMKELVLKKKTELEEICRRIHLVEYVYDNTESTIDAIEAGAIDASLVLEQIEVQISTVKEEAFCRKDILEKVEKWLASCDEESWLEEYNRDENRFGAGRGAHLALKRAEKARALVNKLPSIVENLAEKVIQWENERAIDFTYDGVRVLSMLENYMVVRQEKEEQRKRQRDQKRLQGQLIAEQEALYGSKPSPTKPQSAKKIPRTSTGGPNRRLSLGGLAIQSPKPNFLQGVKSARSAKKTNEIRTFSPGQKGTDVAGYPMKKLSYNAATTPTREADMPRKPFAPLLPVSNILSTPSKKTIFNVAEEEIENKKPASIPIPKTPMAVSAPMDMAATPATISLVSKAAVNAAPTQELEYSFEERRFDFFARRNDLPSLVQM